MNWLKIASIVIGILLVTGLILLAVNSRQKESPGGVSRTQATRTLSPEASPTSDGEIEPEPIPTGVLEREMEFSPSPQPENTRRPFRPIVLKLTEKPPREVSWQSSRRITFRFSLEDKTDFEAYEYSLEPGPQRETLLDWAVFHDLEPGEYLFKVRARKKTGVVSGYKEWQFEVLASKPPVVSIVYPRDGEDVVAPALGVLLSATDEDGKIIRYRCALDDRQKYRESTGRSFQFENLASGEYTILAQAVDNASKESKWTAARVEFVNSLLTSTPTAVPTVAPPRSPVVPPDIPATPPPPTETPTPTGTPSDSPWSWVQDGNEAALILPGGASMVFIRVPAGTFLMGSPETEPERDVDEGPLREVPVSSFWIGKFEVTNEQFRVFQPSHQPSDHHGEPLGHSKQPVVEVSWTEASEFCRFLSEKTGRLFRLPSEAEWEYACRAGTQTARYWGNNPAVSCEYANIADQTAGRMDPSLPVAACDDGYFVSAPVGQFKPNDFGLYDMLGNVWEWCQDTWNEDYYDSPEESTAWESGPGMSRVLRGGSWVDRPPLVRCAVRNWFDVESKTNFLGFRCIAEPGE